MYTKADFDRDHPMPENPFAFPWEEEYHQKVVQEVEKKVEKKEREKAKKERGKIEKEAEKRFQQAEKQHLQIEKLKIQIGELRGKIDNSLELHQEGILSKELYLSKTTPLQKQLKELEEKAAVLSK